MALLDSLIAFALTLAALATVVTILMEITIRACGLKRKGQVDLVRRLLDKVVASYLPQKESQWNVIKGVLENPFSGVAMVPEGVKQRYFGWKAAGIYNEVSLEHVLRRLLETSKPEMLEQAEEDLKARLQIIAGKYEEYASALAANFKRNAQMWSIFVGIGVALVMNVDGVRLLTTYLQDPVLRQSVIEKLPAPQGGEQETVDGEDDVDAYLNKLKARLSDISDLALPVGSAYFPHCQIGWLRAETDPSADPLCGKAGVPVPFGAYALWFFKVLVTGILIGLGAPFWYDVARRLAAVRQAFGGKPAGEERYRGTDARGTDGRSAEKARSDLLDSVIKDAKEAKAKGVVAA